MGSECWKTPLFSWLEPDYFGFLMNKDFVVGYGLETPQTGRNLRYIGGKSVSVFTPALVEARSRLP